MRTSRGVTIALVLLVTIAAACGGSEARTSDSAPTSEPVDAAAKLKSMVEGLDGFRGVVLVARGDELLLSQGYGTADAEAGLANDLSTRFRIASISKQFTGLAILILSEQGLIDVSESVCEYIPSCPAAWQPITIENLVGHMSGIPDYVDLADYEATKAVPTNYEALVGRVRDLPLDREPGSVFRYSNSNYAILGWVIELVSGATYEGFLRSNFFQPLGMADTGFEKEGDGLAVGYTEGDVVADAIDMSVAGSLSSTAEDLLRWNRAIASDTAAPGDATTDMLTPIETTTDFVGFGYGYGIYVSTTEGGLAFHDGGIDGFTSVLVNDVGNEITVVILCNTNDSGDLLSVARDLRAVALTG